MAGLNPGPVERPDGAKGPQTAWLIDPDGYRIELVRWPPGHPDGITAADFHSLSSHARLHRAAERRKPRAVRASTPRG